MTIDLKPNEVVVKAGDSKHYNSEEKIDGKLILTNQRIYFKTINKECNRFNQEILPEEIKEVHYFNTNLFSANGLNVITKDGQELKFSIKKRNTWCEAINKMY